MTEQYHVVADQRLPARRLRQHLPDVGHAGGEPVPGGVGTGGDFPESIPDRLLHRLRHLPGIRLLLGPGRLQPVSATQATSVSPAVTQPQYGGNLIWIRNTGITGIGAPQDIPTLTSTYMLTSPCAETLVLTDDQERIVPLLAESVDTAADGKSITFKLKKASNSKMAPILTLRR